MKNIGEWTLNDNIHHGLQEPKLTASFISWELLGSFQKWNGSRLSEFFWQFFLCYERDKFSVFDWLGQLSNATQAEIWQVSWMRSSYKSFQYHLLTYFKNIMEHDIVHVHYKVWTHFLVGISDSLSWSRAGNRLSMEWCWLNFDHFGKAFKTRRLLALKRCNHHFLTGNRESHYWDHLDWRWQEHHVDAAKYTNHDSVVRSIVL
jgi:hypothetical protein